MRFIILFSFLFLGCSQLKAPDKKQKFFNVAWSKNLDPHYVSGNLPIGLGAPRIFNDIVYMGSLSGIMSAYDLETGRVLWSQDDKTELGAPVELFGESIAYGGINGRLFVRNYLTGKLKYSIDLASPIESAPYYFNGRLLVYLRGHQIVHLDAETGKILWAYKRAVPVTTTLQRTTKPLVLGNKIIVGFADGFAGALSVQEGLLLWETKVVEQSKFVDVDLNPALAGTSVIIGSSSGELKALNPDSGAVSRSFGLSVMAHPLLKGNQLLLGTNDGEVVLMGMDGEILKRVRVSDQPVSAVTWWRNNIVAASFDGYLRVVDPLTFKVFDEFAMGYDYSSIFSDLVVHEDFLTIHTSRNHLYTFH